MTRTDTAMRFWLRYVEQAGGLWDDAGDTALVVLPDDLADGHGYPDEVRVTADPDVAREDGATLLLAGHPWLTQAAEAVIGSGDIGLVRLPRPTTAPPSGERLLAAARDQFPIDHGRIDASGGAAPGTRTLIRVGALVSYTVSSDMTFQEPVECWVDVESRLEVPDQVIARLARLVDVEHPERSAEQPRVERLVAALAYAHQRIDTRAAERALELTRQVAQDRDREVERAAAYYTDALHSLQRRLDSAPPDRAATLSAKIAATGAERDRRVAEIEEKYRGSRAIRPFRLHVLAVPVLRLPVDVRRGERRYPLVLDWMLSARRFAAVRCPACGSAAPLAAAKFGLGCEQCLRKSVPPAASAAPPPPVALPAAPATPPAPVPSSPVPSSTVPSSTVLSSPVPRAQQPITPVANVTVPRSDEAVRKAGGKLATSVWELAAAHDRRIQRLYAPQSPAAAMHRLFGPSGPLRAVGCADSEAPRAVTTSDSVQPRVVSDSFLLDGRLRTARAEHGFQLCWRYVGSTALIEEVSPFERAQWPRQIEPRYWPGGRAGARLHADSPRPRIELDPVAARLWSAVSVNGLPLMLRAFAAWWRIDDADHLLTRHPPAAIAAAITRAVTYRAGLGGRYDEAAATFRVDADAVRSAAADVQRRLRLAEGCPW